MALLLPFLALFFIFALRSASVLCISPTDTLTYGSSLSVDSRNDVLTSQNGVFSAGFYQVGDNAFCFAIWFATSSNKTVSWMANRDQPVIGKHSILKLKKNGNLKLKSLPVDGTGSGLSTVWSSNTISEFPLQLQLLDSGNLVLNRNSSESVAWQSFDSPTNTLLPSQLLTGAIDLISSRRETDYSSGFYKLSFGKDDVLQLLFDGPTTKPSIYWPESVPDGSIRNRSSIAWFDSFGYFSSSDGLEVSAADLGLGPQRRLTLDFDGNLRMYSLQEDGGWTVVWIALQEQCKVHGLCGSNSLCRYDPAIGRRCICLPGYKLRNSTDWLYGCELEFDLKQRGVEVDFVEIAHVGIQTRDDIFFINYTPTQCQDGCKGMSSCKAFVTKINDGSAYSCYLKMRLLNGYQSPNSDDVLNIKVPKNIELLSGFNTTETSQLNCKLKTHVACLRWRKSHGVGPLGFLIWFATAIGSMEIAIIFLVWCFLFRYSHDVDPSTSFHEYILAITGFRRYSYMELKRVTSNFREEIGRGGSSVVYKGVLADGRMVAVKKLDSPEHGKEEFLAEMSTIGRIKHKNLMETLGYCAEGKHRLLVYEFVENRSLAENLSSGSLGWRKRYKIALGTARGLAYLHEECLEWVLHCDVKPQNVLLDSDFEPKVGDFGLSKLLNRGRAHGSYFSRIRGTRGYMAPEWISNAAITSKVDVYSYGVVALQLVTGKSPAEIVQRVLDARVGEEEAESWVEEIADPALEGNYDMEEMKAVALAALLRVEEDKDDRPTMRQVVDMLQKPHE